MCTECQFLVEKGLNYKDNYVHNRSGNPHSLENHDSISYAISLKTKTSPISTHNYDNKHCSLIDTFMGNMTLKLDILTRKSATRRTHPILTPLRYLRITLIHIA